ncbi:MAG: hypothetical protein LJE83_01575 [Gammaproteobacteria bacterium]|nr:hypothetical protein [Gammaproteobacteria bacterium]
MSAKDIWYGVLEAGEKSSPVVRDATLDTSEGKVYLYNYVRNQFIEYAKAIVEPKLRELEAGDITRDELDRAFNAASQAFTSSRKVRALTETKPATARIKDEADDTPDFDMEDEGDMEEFIDDD